MAIRLTSQVGAVGGPGGWLFPLALLEDARYVDTAQAFINRILNQTPEANACTHVKTTSKGASATTPSVYFMGSKNCDRQVPQARLHDYHTDRAAPSAKRAGILWHHYGEQPVELSTFYFYLLAQQCQRSRPLTSLQDRL